MAIDTFNKSLWSALTPSAATYSSLAGEHDVDVLVIGGGLLGLSTAFHLAEGGSRVMVLEADEVGFGASGRNTGFVVPSLSTALGPEDVRARVGERGDLLMRLVGDLANIVFDLVNRLGIDCAPERTGWLQPAHTLDMLRVLQQRQKDWQGLDQRVDILSADETRTKIGGGSYAGALFNPTGGNSTRLLTRVAWPRRRRQRVPIFGCRAGS